MTMTHHRSLTRRAVGLLAVAAALAATVGCASKPEVRHDRAPGADLGAYTTFAFTEFTSDGGSPYASMLAAHLKQATRTQMQRLNYSYDASRPDLLVNLRLIVREKQEVRSTPAAYGRFGWRAWPAGGVETVEYRQGTVAIDLIDRAQRTVVWHGAAEGRLDLNALEQPGTAIESAVGEIFATFPSSARER
jgi:hypothetical protein